MVHRSVALTILSALLVATAGCGGGPEGPFAPSSPLSGGVALTCSGDQAACDTTGADAAQTIACPSDEREKDDESDPAALGCSVVRRHGGGGGSIQKTRYLAFGDSITAGFVRDQQRISRSRSYPAQLEKALRGKYSNQKPSVVNAGVEGERSAQGRGRLGGVLARYGPEVLLLLEGYNNIRYVDPASIEDDLRAMVGEAQGRSISVLLATLTPVSPKKEEQHPGTRAAIDAVNSKIRALAPELGVPLVDLHSVLNGRWNLFGKDGLHPTSSGYRVISDSFFNEIVSRFGQAPPSQLTNAEPGSLERASADRLWLGPRPPGDPAFEPDASSFFRGRRAGDQ